MLVVLSMTMATQYVTTKVGYSYDIVHPSNADIRFVGFDNASDEIRLLRTFSGTNTSGALNLTLNFGNVSENQNLTYTAAFGIVNEEKFKVNITHVNVNSGEHNQMYLDIWLHNRPNLMATNEQVTNRTHIWKSEGGAGSSMGFSNSTCAWILAAGDSDPDTLNGTVTETPWDNQAFVRYTNDTGAYAMNETRDYVWVQISINIPDGATVGTYWGQIVFYFEANTETADTGG